MTSAPDPAQQWAHLLEELPVKSRHAVAESLRHYARSGWTDSVESVQLIVDYAAGRIDSGTYATETLKLLGVDQAPGPPTSMPNTPADLPPATKESRERAVQDYVTGRIPVEELLRLISDRRR